MPVSRDSVTFFDKDLKPETLSDVLRIYDQRWIERLRKSIVDNDRDSTGSLQQSLVSETDVSPTYIAFKILATGEAGKYWKVVDKGRRAGKPAPPQQAMLDFIKNRAIKPIGLTSTNAESAYKSLAYMLGQSIKKKGIKATNFVSEAITDKEITDFKKAVLKAIKKGLL